MQSMLLSNNQRRMHGKPMHRKKNKKKRNHTRCEAAEAIKAGTLHVFDTTTFTVEGAELTSYEADVDTDADYAPDHEVVSDGYFHESEYRSAPYFNVQIDGINLLDTAF